MNGIICWPTADKRADQLEDRLIEAERLRRDLAAYRRVPAYWSEAAIALLADTSGLVDETDWEALYPEVENDE